MNREKLKDTLNAEAKLKALGIEITEIAESFAKAKKESFLIDESLPYLSNPKLFELAYITCMAALLGTGKKYFDVTGSISLINRRVSGPLTAKAFPVHKGKTTGIYAVEIFDAKDELAAKATFTTVISKEDF